MSRHFPRSHARPVLNSRISGLQFYWLIILSICAALLAPTSPLTHPAGADELAAGLRGEYFDNQDFTDLKFSRTDATIDFNWSFDAPEPSINPEGFSIRWTGQVTAPASGDYIFITRSDDGVRLWINDQLVIDNFTSHPETEDRSAPVALTSGQSYNLRLEYFEMTANALIRLLWIRPDQGAPEVIPQSQLTTPVIPNPAPILTGISPEARPAGGPAFALVVMGSNFVEGAVVQWDNAPRPTMFISDTQLNASISATDLGNAGLVKITAVNPLPGGGTSNQLIFTVSGGFEADVNPRPNGNNNGAVTIADWTQVGRFSTGLEAPLPGGEFQRTDCAPRITLGDGRLSISDWVQAGRYATGLDPVAISGGPAAPNAPAADEPSDVSPDNLFGFSAKGLFSLQDFASLKLGRPAGRTRFIQALGGSGDKINIVCTALGDEHGFGFSLRFDAKRWRFISAKTGVDTPHAALLVNRREASIDRIGIALALPPGRRLAAGTRQLVVLTFRPHSGACERSVSPDVAFTDQPIPSETVDEKANQLGAIYLYNDSAHGKPTLARASMK
jgi:hypothetical protein